MFKWIEKLADDHPRRYPLGPGEMPIRDEHYDSMIFGRGYCDMNGKMHPFKVTLPGVIKGIITLKFIDI